MERWLSTTKVTPFNQRDSVGPMPVIAMLRQSGTQTPTAAMLTKSQLIGAVLNWSLCLLSSFLLLTQLLTILLSGSRTTEHVIYGSKPSLGLSIILGQNDEPYSDRVLVCMRRSRRFEATSVNEALAMAFTVAEDDSGTAVNGYRVVNRTGNTVSEITKSAFSSTCSLINSTLEYMISACNTLGYLNSTGDNLRIVGDVNDSSLHLIRNSLPVLIMPFWDNALSARYAIPGSDGHACVFRLSGKYESTEDQDAYLYSVDRSVRESKTIEWLGRPGGEWKNGWYEDTQGMRWYTDIQISGESNMDGISSRKFNMIAKRELNCSIKAQCPPQVVVTQWGSNLKTTTEIVWMNSITISNGMRFGIFLFEAYVSSIVTCVYDFANLISDLSFVYLLLRWILSMVAVQRGFVKGVTNWHNTDIGCLANSYSFEALPFTMIPRLKMIIIAFYTVGCGFEGDQMALSDSWFVMYPAIVEIVLITASIVNFLARVLRRRMTSWQIPVSILLLSVMHYVRQEIGSSKLFGFDGRVSTLILSYELEDLSLFQVVTPSIALRLSGNIKSLLWIRLSILFLNAVPLLYPPDMSLNSKQSQEHVSIECEQSLCIRACNIGGVGHSNIYEWSTQGTERRLVLNSYEVVRLGYVVVGNSFLMTWESWQILALIMPFRRVFLWRNHSFMVFDVATACDGSHTHRIGTRPYLITMTDPKLLRINWWDIDSRSLV